jgi:hypothetical protein
MKRLLFMNIHIAATLLGIVLQVAGAAYLVWQLNLQVRGFVALLLGSGLQLYGALPA